MWPGDGQHGNCQGKEWEFWVTLRDHARIESVMHRGVPTALVVHVGEQGAAQASDVFTLPPCPRSASRWNGSAIRSAPTMPCSATYG